MIDDYQIWLIVGILSGVFILLGAISIIVNAYITSRRLANVLSDVEEILHADFKELETKIEIALNRIRMAEVKSDRE